MSNKYFIDVEAERIQVYDHRFYMVEDLGGCALPSSTTIMEVKSKKGLEIWKQNLASMGIDSKKVGQEYMEYGSNIHQAIEDYENGKEIVFYDKKTGEALYDFYNEWKPILRYTEAREKHQVEPVLIEQMIYSIIDDSNKEIDPQGFAGTLDLLCWMTDGKTKKKFLAIVDHKRSSSVMPTYEWQQASYKYALIWMYKNNAKMRQVLESKGITLKMLEELRCFLLLLNTDSKKGWRMSEVRDTDRCFQMFIACFQLWYGEYRGYNYMKDLYPTSIKLNKKGENNG